jgi:hypothetical protein
LKIINNIERMACRMKSISLFLILSLLTFFGCKEETTQLPAQKKNLSLYILSDTSITAVQAWNIPLDSLKLASKPFATQNDIASYTWSTHSFTVHPILNIAIEQMKLLSGKSAGFPFVVVVEGKRIYLGTFWWSYSSLTPQGAYIVVTDPSPYQIQFDSTALQPLDLRSDQRIHDVLKESGILSE